MKHISVPAGSPRALLLLLALLFAAAPAARAQETETEPNSSCAAAQDLTAATFPSTLTGSLDTPPASPDIDFYRFAAAPGDLLRIELAGDQVYPFTLVDPLLAVYDASCNLIALNDDWAGAGSRLEIAVPADGVLVVAATSNPDYGFTGAGSWAGTYRLGVRRLALGRSVSGRVVDARSNGPLPGAYVVLNRCEDGNCQTAGVANADDLGGFRFADGLNTYGPLLAGEYEIYSQAPNHDPYESRFTLTEGQDFDFGTIALVPHPIVGSVRGRLVDAQTAAPLSGAGPERAWVELLACESETAPVCWRTDSALAGPDGTFVFQGSNEWSARLAGHYRLRGYADQYQIAETPTFFVAVDQHYDAGDVGLKSLPVRIYLGEGCGDIPSAGGTCRFTARIVNGMPGRLQGDAWSLVNANGVGFPGQLTAFQTGTPKALSLGPGESVTLPFSFPVPGTVEDGTSICVQTLAAQRPYQFNTLGWHHLFCLSKGAQGFSVLPEEQKRDAVERSQGRQ